MKDTRPCCETCAKRNECEGKMESSSEDGIMYFCSLYRREGRPIRAKKKTDDEWEGR